MTKCLSRFTMQKMAYLLFLILLLLTIFHSGQIAAANESSVELTYEDFEAKTKGKTVFIKFYSPTCPHCKSMAPDWELMAKEWVDHEQGLVGAVDCTKESRFCEEMKIKGVPTFFYGEPAYRGILLKQFTDVKTYKVMSEFAKATLIKPICSPVNLDACEETDRRQMMYFLSLGTWELGAVIRDKLDAIQMAQDQFQVEFDAMQSSYDQMGTEHELLKSTILSKINLLEGVLVARKNESV